MAAPHPHPSRPQPALSRREVNAMLLALGGGLCAGLASGLTGCGPVKPPRVSLGGTSQARLVPMAARVDAVPGRTLVTPVRVDGPISGSASPALRLADGRELDASLVWIGVETDAESWTSWLPAFERWVVATPSDGSIPASIGAWHLVAPMPADPDNQSLELNGRSVSVNWLADPDTLRPASARGVWEPWTLGTDTPQPDPQLLVPEWRSPLRLWHARLVTTSLGRPTATPGIWQVRGESSVLDRLADLIEARWRVGLARLWYADEDACRRLLQTLGRTVEFAPDVHAPAWPTDPNAMESLLSDLLDPRLKGKALGVRASAWVESMPQSAVWIEDDAAELLGETSQPLARIRVAGLGDNSQLVWTSGDADHRVGEPKTLDPGSLTEVLAPVPAGYAITGGRRFTVRCGAEAERVVASELVPIRPPGVRCGPLRLDWTLTAWADSAPGTGDLADAAHSAVALIYRDTSGASPSGWAAFLECSTSAPPASTRSAPESSDTDIAEADRPGREEGRDVPPGEPVLQPTRDPDEVDEVSLWFGQRGNAASVLRVLRTGVVRDDRASGTGSVYNVADEGDRWSVSVPIPVSAIEPGGVLRIGVMRRDPRGVRTAWPRRMMPWDLEPSRIAIDLRTWSGLPGR